MELRGPKRGAHWEYERFKHNDKKYGGCLKSLTVIADLFREPGSVVLNWIPAQGRNDIPY